ncbi:MAG: hypothetical protein MH472_10365, partial [Bacteroidia bacterium]|nr:hypothetical protein [Bacteroidia bacterium]
MRVLLILSMLLSGWLYAQPVLYYTDSTQELELAKYSAFLEKNKGEASILDMLELPGSSFIKNESGLLFFEKNRAKPDVWLRFDMMYFGGNSKNAVVEVNNPLIDEIAFYWVQNNTIIDSNLCGDDVPFYQRDIHYRNPIFKVSF